jgi:hypothetical protein
MSTSKSSQRRRRKLSRRSSAVCSATTHQSPGGLSEGIPPRLSLLPPSMRNYWWSVHGVMGRLQKCCSARSASTVFITPTAQSSSSAGQRAVAARPLTERQGVRGRYQYECGHRRHCRRALGHEPEPLRDCPGAQPCSDQDHGRRSGGPAWLTVPARSPRPARLRRRVGGSARLARTRGTQFPRCEVRVPPPC